VVVVVVVDDVISCCSVMVLVVLRSGIDTVDLIHNITIIGLLSRIAFLIIY
jgi:hypothetical protein